MEIKRERRDKVNYYLDMAEVVGKRSTCIRKHYGAVIVKHDEVVSTGYNGAHVAAKTVLTLASVGASNSTCLAVRAMRCAAVCMQNRMRLSAPLANGCWAVLFI